MTELCFCLMRYEISFTIRQLSYGTPGMLKRCPKITGFTTIAEKERNIEELERTLHDKYLQYCDNTNPLHWVTYNVAKLVT